MTDLVYFLCYPNADHSSIAVIDILSNRMYDRREWDLVDDSIFTSLVDAVIVADNIANDAGIKRERFESRHESSMNEPNQFVNAAEMKAMLNKSDEPSQVKVSWLLIHYYTLLKIIS